MQLSAAVYTQLSDVEHEWNGLLTYDRHPKCREQMRAVLRPVIMAYRQAVPTARTQAREEISTAEAHSANSSKRASTPVSESARRGVLGALPQLLHAQTAAGMALAASRSTAELRLSH